jgi:hypothetical protein
VPTGWLPHGLRVAAGWPRGGLGMASGTVRDAIPPVPPKTAKSRPQPPKSAIESHLRFAESFRVHGPISTSEFAAVSTPPPRDNSLRYSKAAQSQGIWRRGCSISGPIRPKPETRWPKAEYTDTPARERPIESSPIRVSVFGLRSGLGFRPSDFRRPFSAHAPRPIAVPGHIRALPQESGLPWAGCAPVWYR